MRERGNASDLRQCENNYVRCVRPNRLPLSERRKQTYFTFQRKQASIHLYQLSISFRIKRERKKKAYKVVIYDIISMLISLINLFS